MSRSSSSAAVLFSVDFVEAVAVQACRGLYDSISFDKAIPVIVNSSSVAGSFGKW